MLTARVARGGAPVPAPRFFRRPEGTSGPGEPAPPPGTAPEGFKAATFERIVEGMWRSVNDGGTGQGARVEGFDVCGKTGSTQVMSRESAERLAQAGREVKTHSWFSGFAPRDDPRIVVTVLVEYGGGGGATAAPLAGRVLAKFREGEAAR
jgi:cell division protein FtsI/penicillin-binding protein 2